MFAPGRRHLAETLRELSLGITFFAAFRLLVALAVLALLVLLATVVTDRLLAVAAAAVTLPALVQVDHMLARARRELAETRRTTLWAAARAAEHGGDASAAELLAGFRLFDRRGGWLTSAGRELALERSLALLAATFDHEGRLPVRDASPSAPPGRWYPVST